MRSGEMDRRIVIEQNTPVADATGDPVDSWATLATVWADLRNIRGAETFDDDREQASRQTTFRIRWRSDIDDTKLRINYDGRIWDIISISEIGRQAGLDIRAEARGN